MSLINYFESNTLTVNMNLITGATGFLGSYLAKLLLSKGEKVRAIRRSTSDLSLLGEHASEIEWIDGDVLDIPSLETAMKDVKRVYHCAAVISFIPSEVNHMMKVNVEGTANVMNMALKMGVEKVVHTSSTAAFGVAPNGKVIDENYSDPGIGKSFWYFRSKQYGEREAWRAKAEGLNVVIACPSTILGAGWWDDQPNTLFRDIYKGLFFYTSSTNGFVDVRDVAQCLNLLMESDITNDKFIISSANNSFRELMWTIADELKVKRPSVSAEKWLLSIAWRVEALKILFTQKSPIISRETARIARINFAYNNEKITNALNYKFRPIRETVADTSQAFLRSVAEEKEYGAF